MGNAEVRQTVFGSGNIFTATGDVRINYHLPPAEADERRILLQLTTSVRQFWIAGVLERSVHEAATIELRKEARPEAVHHPWECVLELPGQPAQALAGERKIGEVFAETGRALLILGEPGAGKTITLLELARDLIDRFERDPAHSAPVVLNLSTWEKRRGALAAWVETELKTKYFVPPRRSRVWLAQSRLTLLLDGLDEMAPENQAACVQSINKFLENTGVPGIAVCSRFAEYVALPDRLRFTGAVCLQPLSPAQIDEFLERGGPQLAAVRSVIKTDALLHELARSPLLLNIISLAYRDSPVEGIARQAGESIESRRRHLFDAYVQRMFQRVTQAHQEFPEDRTRHWLGWLARRMREHSLTLFSLDQLQPSWLASAREVWTYALTSRMASALTWALSAWSSSLLLLPAARYLWLRGTILVLLGALTAGLIAGVTDGRRLAAPPRQSGKWRTRLRVLCLIGIHGIAMTTVFGVVSALFLEPVDPILLMLLGAPEGIYGWQADAAAGLRTGLFFGLVFGLRSIRMSRTHDIWLSEALRLSWSAARRGAKISGPVGIVIGALFAISLVLSQPTTIDADSAVEFAGIIIGAAIGLGFLFAVVGAAFGMFAPSDLPGKIRPGQWLRRSVQNALLAGCVVTATFSLIFVPGAHLFRTFTVPLALLNSFGLGIAAALWYGGFDAIQHLVLRFMLRRRGLIPKRFVRFLDYGTRLIFLQKVGSGYLFVHRQLLEYFADQPATSDKVTVQTSHGDKQ